MDEVTKFKVAQLCKSYSELGSLESFTKGVTRTDQTFRIITLSYFCNNPNER